MVRKFSYSLALLSALVPALLSAAPPSGAQVERLGTDQLLVSWTSADPVDVLVATRPDAPIKSARLVSPRDADGKEALNGVGKTRSYFYLRNSRTGELTKVAERLLPLEAGSNFRDIGGYPAASGRHVRWGMIFRSGGTPLLSQSDLTQVGGLGLTNMVDLRSDEERVLAPTRIDGVTYTAVGYSMGQMDMSGGMESAYGGFPKMLAPHLRQVFAKLLRSEQPLAYNCSAGQDRTGFVTAIILSALGTPRETIFQDYLLSTKFRRPEFEMSKIDLAAHSGNPVAAMFAKYQSDPRARQPQPLMTAEGKPFLAFAFAEIDSRWGSVDGYLRNEIGLTSQDIAKFRKLYTE